MVCRVWSQGGWLLDCVATPALFGILRSSDSITGVQAQGLALVVRVGRLLGSSIDLCLQVTSIGVCKAANPLVSSCAVGQKGTNLRRDNRNIGLDLMDAECLGAVEVAQTIRVQDPDE